MIFCVQNTKQNTKHKNTKTDRPNPAPPTHDPTPSPAPRFMATGGPVEHPLQPYVLVYAFVSTVRLVGYGLGYALLVG